MSKDGFDVSGAFNRDNLQRNDPSQWSGETVTKSLRIPVELWSQLDTAFKQRGLDASNGMRLALADWLRRNR